jgi:hypothetical protein
LPNPSFSYVGYSAAQALGVALYDEFFDSTQVNYTLIDSDIDEHEQDTAFYAACAAAGGPIWSPNTDSIKRRAFWEWWLMDAVPTAWEAFPDS